MRRAVVKYPLSEKRLTIGKKQMNTIFFPYYQISKAKSFLNRCNSAEFSIFIL
jgi:hypothetical protein